MKTSASMSMRQRRRLAEMTERPRSTEPCGFPRAKSAGRLAYIRLPFSKMKYLWNRKKKKNQLSAARGNGDSDHNLVPSFQGPLALLQQETFQFGRCLIEYSERFETVDDLPFGTFPPLFALGGLHVRSRRCRFHRRPPVVVVRLGRQAVGLRTEFGIRNAALRLGLMPEVRTAIHFLAGPQIQIGGFRSDMPQTWHSLNQHTDYHDSWSPKWTHTHTHTPSNPTWKRNENVCFSRLDFWHNGQKTGNPVKNTEKAEKKIAILTDSSRVAIIVNFRMNDQVIYANVERLHYRRWATYALIILTTTRQLTTRPLAQLLRNVQLRQSSILFFHFFD